MKPKDLVAIEKKLRESLIEERFVDYTDVTQLRMENENYCIETYSIRKKYLNQARPPTIFDNVTSK